MRTSARRQHMATAPINPDPTRPLITFYVIAYNQEKFVSDAIAGALSQTWQPLEIILSDDASRDSTYDIMRAAAESYQGPHRIVLNRNERTLGVGAHINRVLELSSGDFIVASAGDDISVAERTERLYGIWKNSGHPVWLVYSNLLEVNAANRVLMLRDFGQGAGCPAGTETLYWSLREHIDLRCPKVHGASFAYPKEIYSLFGPMNDGVVFEDSLLNWRAEFLGEVALCREPLVRHRNHSGQVTNVHAKAALLDALYRRRALKWSDVVTIRQTISEAESAFRRGFIDPDLFASASEFLRTHRRIEENEYTALYGNWLSRIACLAKNPGLLRRQGNAWLFVLRSLLPHPLTSALFRWKACAKAD